MKKSEESLRDLWDTTQSTNTLVVEIPEEKKGTQSIFKEIMAKSFST